MLLRLESQEELTRACELAAKALTQRYCLRPPRLPQAAVASLSFNGRYTRARPHTQERAPSSPASFCLPLTNQESSRVSLPPFSAHL